MEHIWGLPRLVKASVYLNLHSFGPGVRSARRRIQQPSKASRVRKWMHLRSPHRRSCPNGGFPFIYYRMQA